DAVLRPAGVHDDARGEARRARQRGAFPRLRAPPAARPGLLDPRASPARADRRRKPPASHQPRIGSAGARVPRAIPLGLQPLQDSGRRAATAVSRIILALMWLIHWLPFRALAAIGNAIGAALFWLIPERRRVTRINLR